MRSYPENDIGNYEIREKNEKCVAEINCHKRPAERVFHMILARVLGSVVSTLKHPAYEAAKLMVIQPVQPDGSDRGNTLLAVDTAGAGAGETVLVLRQGVAAAQVLGVDRPPIRSVIVGIVDQISCEPQA